MALIRALTSAMALNGFAASASAYARTSLRERRAGDDSVHEAPRLGLGGRVPPALHDDLLRARGPDEAHEAGRRRDPERYAEVDLGDPELRFGGGPAKVAGERQPPAAADGVAVDHGDRRLLQALEQRVGALEQPAELALALAERLPGAPRPTSPT